jgi:hypothetical protein
MSSNSNPTKAVRRIAKVIAVATVIGVAGVGASLPIAANPAGADAVESPYNTCPGSPCILKAEIDTKGPTVKFHGETKFLTQGSQWYLTVRRAGVVVASYASDYLDTNKLDADLGPLPAGEAYDLTVVAGAPGGDQRLNKSFTTGPAVTAVPTATNVKLAFGMTVGVTAQAYIRTSNGVIVASATSTGASTSHILTTAAILDPTTVYSYQVNAYDAQGRSYTKWGTFQTRNVRLEAQVTGLQINNDSDSFGAGELRAQLHVGGAKKWIWQNEKSVETAWGPKYFAVSASAALPTAVRSVPISVVVSDDDCEGIGSLCTSGVGDLAVGSGTQSDAQWATATVTAKLPNTTTTTPWTTFLTTVNGPVGFSVTGMYRWVMV